MTSHVEPSQPLTSAAMAVSPRGLYLLGAAVAFVLGSAAVPNPVTGLFFGLIASTLAVLAGLSRWIAIKHETEQKLLHSQVAGFAAHDASPSFTTDDSGNVVYQNRAAVGRFGSRGGQTLPKTLAEVFANPGAVLHRIQNKAAAMGAAREDVVTRKGHIRISVHRITDGAFLWRLDDIAERAAPGLGAASVSLPMLVASRSGTILFVNEAMRTLVGDRPKTLDRIFADMPLRPGGEHEVIARDGPVRAIVAEIDGHGGRREIFLLPAPDQPNGPGLRNDGAAFEALPVALARLSADGRIIDINLAGRALIGAGTAGAPLSDLLEGLGRPVDDWIAEVLAARTEAKPEVLRATKAGREVYVQVALGRTADKGRPGLIAVMSDATQLKTLEAQFVQSQKMQAIGQLAGGVAHDFNNLLTAISGHCDLLLLRHDQGDPDYADLTQISQNSNRAAGLVGQLLAFSRKQTMKPAVIDLRDTLGDLMHLLNRLVGEKVHLTFDHDPGLRPIRADKRQIEQVVMNLVVNARDAMPDGGEIRVVTAMAHLHAALERDRVTLPAGEYVTVRVIDDGIGIAPDLRSKVFEPFFTTKRPGEGTGLGLSTAYGIVKQSGGYIFVDSVQGTGTTFTLYFPVHFGPVPTQAEHRTIQANVAPPVRARAGEGVVLLVEDEAPVRAFASRALRLRGFTVIEAENAEEALSALADPSLAVDVFVTDVIMPGMDGPTWVREALKQRPNTRVVFVSGYAEESLRGSRERIPNSVFLPKPFSLADLTATVQGQIH